MAERAIAELGPWLAQAEPPGGDHRAAADAGFPEVA
jgi:hypothetical protein